MPPCYTFNKIILPNDGMPSCATEAAGKCPVQTWFWVLAAAAAVSVFLAGGSK